MKYYLDTSAFCSLYVPEKHTKKMLSFIEMHDGFFISRLVETEFYSALAIKLRTKNLSKISTQKILHMFELHLTEGRYEKLYITDEVFNQAIRYLKSHSTSLKTLDSLHLACAGLNKMTLVTSDKVLYQSAHHFNLDVLFI